MTTEGLNNTATGSKRKRSSGKDGYTFSAADKSVIINLANNGWKPTKIAKEKFPQYSGKQISDLLARLKKSDPAKLNKMKVSAGDARIKMTLEDKIEEKLSGVRTEDLGDTLEVDEEYDSDDDLDDQPYSEVLRNIKYYIDYAVGQKWYLLIRKDPLSHVSLKPVTQDGVTIEFRMDFLPAELTAEIPVPYRELQAHFGESSSFELFINAPFPLQPGTAQKPKVLKHGEITVYSFVFEPLNDIENRLNLDDVE